MGVHIRHRGDRGKETVICRCDHPGCDREATRKVQVSQYHRESGRTRTHNRVAKVNSLGFWAVIFAHSRKNSFHLVGDKNS